MILTVYCFVAIKLFATATWGANPNRQIQGGVLAAYPSLIQLKTQIKNKK
jgi:hypothetical protein